MRHAVLCHGGDFFCRVADLVQHRSTAATEAFGMPPQPAWCLAELHRHLEMSYLPLCRVINLRKHPHSLQMGIVEDILWSVHWTAGNVRLAKEFKPLRRRVRPHAFCHDGIERINML